MRKSLRQAMRRKVYSVEVKKMNDSIANREFLYITIASQAFRIKELRKALEKIVADTTLVETTRSMAATALEKDTKP